jgi:hypothetical protein
VPSVAAGRNVNTRKGHQPASWRKQQRVMSESLTYPGWERGAATRSALCSRDDGIRRGRGRLFALGAYLDRDLSGGAGIVAFIAAFACLIGMQFAARRSQQLTIGLLGAFGPLVGLALAPVLAAYALNTWTRTTIRGTNEPVLGPFSQVERDVAARLRAADQHVTVGWIVDRVRRVADLP